MAPAVGTPLTAARRLLGGGSGGYGLCDPSATSSSSLAELVDGASLQFFDRVVVLAVILQRQVVDIPVMAQLHDLLVCLPLRLPSCSSLIRCSMSLLRRSSRFVRSRGIWSRSHSCSSYSLGQVVARPLRATTVPMVDDSVQFIDGVNVPVIMRDSGSAPDSVHRGYGGHSSSQQRQVLDFQQWQR